MVQFVESGVGGASVGDNCCRVDLVESELVNLQNHLDKLLTAQTSAGEDLEGFVLDGSAWTDPKMAKMAR